MFMIVKSQHSSDLFKYFVHLSALCWNWVFLISLYPALSSSVMDFHFSASMSLISFIELFGLPRSSLGIHPFGRQHIYWLVFYALVWAHHSLDFPDLVLPFTFALIPSSILCEHFGATVEKFTLRYRSCLCQWVSKGIVQVA